MKIYLILWGYILCLLFSIPLQAKPLKITTWNTEWLLSSSDTKKYEIPTDIQARAPQDFQKLAHYIKKLKSDIFALQEVGSIETVKNIIPQDQYYFFISQDNVAQHPIIAIRKTLPYHIKQNFDLIALSKVDPHHPLRSGVDLTFYNDKISVRLLVIHLKANCQDKVLTIPQPSCKALYKQQIIIKNWIQKRIEENQPFIILGDFNRILSIHDPFFHALTVNQNLFIPTTKLASPCWGGNYFIDGFILDAKAQQWFIKNSLKVMLYEEKDYRDYNGQKHLSDHCPVSIQLALP